MGNRQVCDELVDGSDYYGINVDEEERVNKLVHCPVSIPYRRTAPERGLRGYSCWSKGGSRGISYCLVAFDFICEP